MSQTYQARRRAQAAPAARGFQTSVPGPSMQELAAGAMPSTEQMGRRVDLPDAIREKMEASFGADFSGVKVFESQAVADAGAEAMTMGSNVAFAPGQLDLTSTSGQALLGHELSHVVSQARGESAGQGFLADSGLEAQADRQGALAAQGESAYSGPVAPLSASGVPASAAGPMQARKKKDIAKATLAREERLANAVSKNSISAEAMEQLGQKSYGRYATYKVHDASNQQEADRLLALFTGEGNEEEINKMMRNDAVFMNNGLLRQSAAMNQEDFDKRVSGYNVAGTFDGLLDALAGSDLSGALTEEERATFQNTADLYRADRANMRSTLLDVAGGEASKPHSTKEQRANRKAYRERRRREIEQGHDNELEYKRH